MEHLSWRKSSYSGNTANCVEVAPTSSWRTSSHSGNGLDCVEVAPAGAAVLVRDTKDREGPVLSFTADQWTTFLAEVATDAPSGNGAAVTEPVSHGVVLHGDGAALNFTPSEWAAFRSGVRDGEFDTLTL